ncbi:MAG: hypothetical protein V4502_05615 [Pseudomonadota bacterium]
MRGISLLLSAAFLSSCAAAPPPPTRTAQDEQRIQRLISGKVAQPNVACLPTYRRNDMTVIDEYTIAFRVGANQTYVAHMQGGCSNLRAGGPYALLTRQFGSSGYCRGDIAQVVDTTNGITVGSCSFGDFTPYVKPRA